MSFILSIVVILAAGFSIFYSMKTRTYRKQQNYSWMRLYNAKTNVAMGVMLIGLAIIQFTFQHLDGWRMGVGTIFLIVGLINFFFGVKHYREYRPQS